MLQLVKDVCRDAKKSDFELLSFDHFRKVLFSFNIYCMYVIITSFLQVIICITLVCLPDPALDTIQSSMLTRADALAEYVLAILTIFL
jgi:hypothetical protein